MSKHKLPNKSNSSTIELEPEVAIAIIGLYSAAADGEGMSSVEEYALTEFLSEVGIFADYDEEDFKELTDKVVSLIENEDPEHLITQSIAVLPDEAYREAAYITATLLVGIDEEVSEDEQDYLFELQEALGISDERAQELIDEIFPDSEEED